MTRDRRLLLLLGLLMAYGLFVVECRYHQREDETTEAKHRHRHKHEPSNRRGHRELDRRFWDEMDYEYDGDSEDSIEDYEARSHYDHPKSHYRSTQKNYYNRMFVPPYPRYHNGGHHAESGWYDENRRRISSRYNTRNRRYRPGRTYHRPAYSRNRDVSDLDDDTEENYDYERPHRYGNGEVDKRERWRNSRRYTPFRRDWRNRMSGYHDARKYHLEDHDDDIDRVDMTGWTDDWKGRSNSSSSKYHLTRNDRKTEEDEDYEDHGGLEEDDKDEDEDDIWKDIADDRNESNEEFDNDFYKSETKPPLKTYDDIIRRLTSDDPTTPKTSVKRDYRNIETNKHVKRDGYSNPKNEPRNVSRTDFTTSTPDATSTTSSYFVKRTTENSTVKSTGHKPSKNTVGDMAKDHNQQEGKIANTQTKTKSLEQDYDEYLNSPDNEKDLLKTGVEDDTTMQADVTNADYTDDDNGDEDEVDSITTSSTTTTTTTTRTTRKPRSFNQHYDHKDSRAYDSAGTGAQYNGYQAKNDYPPMSAHSIHKWQSLGTRESVKETRSNMQQYNKNGKSTGAEIQEAHQYALKVHREGKCEVPRARIILVRQVYPNPSITYIPHCAILHRCSDDTGCCRTETQTCVPKHSHRIELTFYTTTVGGPNAVKRLSFYNHTECECTNRFEYEKPVDQQVYRHQSSSPPQNMKKSPTRKPCRCPSEFAPRISLDGICQCNCHETNENCIKTSRGKGYFSVADRMCIKNYECALPNCEFGDYMMLQGKCPRKKDTFDAMMNYHTNLKHRFGS